MSIAKLPEGVNLPVSPKYDEEAFNKLASNKYLARLALMGSTSKQVQAGKVMVGNYLIIRSENDFNIVGPTFDGLVVSWRPKVLSITADGIISNYDPESADFKRIRALGEMDNAYDLGASFGPEFLVYVPPFKTWTTYFCNSKTSRKEAPNLKTILMAFQKDRTLPAATFKSSPRRNGKNTWTGSDITTCTSPVLQPDWTEAAEIIEKFNNPPKSVKEVIEPGTDAKERLR